VIGPLELAVSMGLSALLLARATGWRDRVVFALLALAEIMASGIWRYVF